jgi:hypothetical protein
MLQGPVRIGLSIAIAALVASASPTRADYGEPVPRPWLGWACGPDYDRHCSGVARGERQGLSCLSDHFHDLGPRCRRHLVVRAAVESCKSDFVQRCAGVVPGGGRGYACLLGNLDRISVGCRRTLEQVAAGGFAFGGRGGSDRPDRFGHDDDPGEDVPFK